MPKNRLTHRSTRVAEAPDQPAYTMQGFRSATRTHDTGRRQMKLDIARGDVSRDDPIAPATRADLMKTGIKEPPAYRGSTLP
jgi:hypothetical protein